MSESAAGIERHRNVSEVCIESGRLNVEGVRGIVEFESRRFGECERLTGDLDSFDTRRAGGRGEASMDSTRFDRGRTREERTDDTPPRAKISERLDRPASSLLALPLYSLSLLSSPPLLSSLPFSLFSLSTFLSALPFYSHLVPFRSSKTSLLVRPFALTFTSIFYRGVS